MTRGSLARARYLVRSNFGRDDGWYIELDGNLVGELSDARWSDMFWDSYAVTEHPISESSALRDDTLWSHCKFTFRNRSTGEVVATAFCGGTPPFIRDGRVLMRALYLPPSSLVERLWTGAVRLLAPRKSRG